MDTAPAARAQLERQLSQALSADDDAAAAQALSALVGAGAAALPLIATHLCHPRPAVAAAARTAAAAIVSAAEPGDLVPIEAALRHTDLPVVRRSPAEAGHLLRPLEEARVRRRTAEASVASFSAAPEAPALLLCASCHSDGFVREAAVRALSERRDGAEVAPLLLRRNDWVPAVRDTAAEALQARLTIDYAPHLLRCLVLLEQLAAQRRAEHGPYCAAALDLLRSAEAAPALRAALSAPDRRARRAAFRLAAESQGLPLRQVLDLALSDRDLVVRLWAARTARARLYGPALREVLAQARGDRGVPVRREVLAAFLDDYPELRRALFDPCAGLRHMARHYLSKKAHIDYAALYREALSAPRSTERAMAAAGIGETGGPGDAEALAPLCADASARVRKAALRALGRVGPEEYAGALLTALRDTDSTPGTRRAALEALHAMLPRVSDPDIARVVLPALRA